MPKPWPRRACLRLGQPVGRHAALARHLEAPLEGALGILRRPRHVRVVGVHPQLAAGALDDRRGQAVVVRVGVGADQQPHVLEPQPGLVERALELAQRARLVQPGVDQHHAVDRGDRERVHVRHARPGQRQPQPPEPGQHAVGARQLALAGGHGSISTPGLRMPLRVDGGLGRAQRRGERLRALAVVPGAVVAADRVVVGDRAAGRLDRLRGGRLDLVPLLELGAAPGRREHREVGRGAVGVGVREAAGHAALGPSAAAARSRTAATNSSKRSQVIAVSKVSARMPAGDQRVAQVGRRRKASRQAPSDSPRRSRCLAAVVAAQLERPRHPGVDRVVGRLEAEHQQRAAVRGGAGQRRLAGVEQPAVRRVEAATGRARAPPPRPRSKPSNSTAAESLKRGRLLHAHPGLGDHAEDPLGADQHPVGARPGAGARQAAALPDAARRDRAHRLDEVVDVGVQRGEVAAGAGGDPAAERRVLERLRVVAQRQPVRLQLLLELRARWRRPGCARRARPGRPRARGRAGRGRS